jgi:branched-chain amino acid transport system substrate-binding protein
MGPDGIVSAEFASIAGPGAEGTLMTFNADPRKNPNAKDAIAKFRAKSYEPEAYTLYSYAAVQVLKQAADEAKSADGKRVAGVMHSGKTFKTVIGDQSFDKKGDITRPDYVVYVWKKGADGKIDYTGNELTN